MEKFELGLNKKSFSLFYNGGELWCEHLDSLYNERDLLIQKFIKDLEQICKPSTSSFIVVNLDESNVDKELLEFIINHFIKLEKPLRKIAFVGLNAKMKNYIKKKNTATSFAMACFDDFEKAKEWLI